MTARFRCVARRVTHLAFHADIWHVESHGASVLMDRRSSVEIGTNRRDETRSAAFQLHWPHRPAAKTVRECIPNGWAIRESCRDVSPPSNETIDLDQVRSGVIVLFVRIDTVARNLPSNVNDFRRTVFAKRWVPATSCRALSFSPRRSSYPVVGPCCTSATRTKAPTI